MNDQIEELATWIMDNVPGEPSQSQGAVETAIRIMGRALTGGPTPVHAVRIWRWAPHKIVTAEITLEPGAPPRIELAGQGEMTLERLDRVIAQLVQARDVLEYLEGEWAEKCRIEMEERREQS